MKSKTQDKKRLNAVGMRICALFAVLAVVFAAFMTTVPHAHPRKRNIQNVNR